MDIEKIAAGLLAVIIAITFHEASHGFVAWRLGDSTAYNAGRVTFNPLKHIDLFGTIILPAMLVIANTGIVFGWAKPVPINPNQLNYPRRDMVLVAAAGPAINTALAVISGLLLSVYGLSEAQKFDFAQIFLIESIKWNVLLAIFNLIPLPPLDGGRIAVGLLPGRLAFALARLEHLGMWIMIGVIFILPLVTKQLGNEINPFATVFIPIFESAIEAVLWLTGLSAENL